MSKVVFEIFVAGPSSRYTPAIQAFREVCDLNLKQGNYQLKIIDVIKEPVLAETKKILAVPTIIRLKPSPEKRVIGDTRMPEKAQQAFQILMDLQNVQIIKNEK